MVEALALRPITAEAPKSKSERQTREVTREDVLWLQLSLSLQHVRIRNHPYAPDTSDIDKKRLKELRHKLKDELGIKRFIPITEVDSNCANISEATGLYAHQPLRMRKLTESLQT